MALNTTHLLISPKLISRPSLLCQASNSYIAAMWQICLDISYLKIHIFNMEHGFYPPNLLPLQFFPFGKCHQHLPSCKNRRLCHSWFPVLSALTFTPSWSTTHLSLKYASNSSTSAQFHRCLPCPANAFLPLVFCNSLASLHILLVSARLIFWKCSVDYIPH